MNVEWWLVRHGLTAWNAERRYQGHSDPSLLPGEASGLTDLHRELEGVNFAAVFASDLRRCRETLAWARPDLLNNVQYDPRLREMNFGLWEGQTYEMLKDNERYRAWIDDPQAVTPPDGESWEAFRSRVWEVCRELLSLTGTLEEGAGLEPRSQLNAEARTSLPPTGGEPLFSPLPPSSPLSPSSPLRPSSPLFPSHPQPHEVTRLLIITHGGVISMLSSLLQPGLGFWDTRVGPGGIQRLFIQG